MLTTEFDPMTGVLTATASGEVTHHDYADVFMPAVDDAVRQSGQIRLLYVFTSEFEGFSAQAMWDDSRLGMQHLQDFTKIAVVSDKGWVRNGVSMFGVFMPAEVKAFRLSEFEAARNWVHATPPAF